MKSLNTAKALGILKHHNHSVFLETNKFDRQNRFSYLFIKPVEIITCSRLEEVKDCLNRTEAALSRGFYVAGFIAYEAGFAFENIIKNHKCKFPFPLLWFGVYKGVTIFSPPRSKYLDYSKSTHEKYSLKEIRANISKNTYLRSIARIKRLIAAGQTYQVNYTFKHKFKFNGSVYKLYLDLKEKQRVAYSALLRIDDLFILSFSPELFFRKDKSEIMVKPMKGTIARGRDLLQDQRNAETLRHCIKNRSENIMIVDLLRNDLGRVSQTGSVNTKSLFDVEKYETLFQMTSTVKSNINLGTSWHSLFKSIFPSGSVTGAPKIRTMQIIKKLEKEPRKVYTGSIGFFSPQGKSAFNVAIRTLLIDKKSNRGEIGVGSGIVYDSDARKEFAECTLKTEFLKGKKLDFELIETMPWKKECGFAFLDLHLKRLRKSALYFNFNYDKKYILDKLYRLARTLNKNKRYRIRLLLFKNGKVGIGATPLDSDFQDRPKYVTFSKKPVKSGDIFLYHKTTNRPLYNEEYLRYQKRGFYDIIYHNERSEITEGAISNIFIKKGSILYTPPIHCGLLDGIYRRGLLKNSGLKIKEKVLFKEDILGADRVYLTNAVRGMVAVDVCL